MIAFLAEVGAVLAAHPILPVVGIFCGVVFSTITGTLARDAFRGAR